MKKQILNKLAGILLATGMIFTMSTAVYTAEAVYSTENQNAFGIGIGDEVYTIDDSQSSNYGITADVTHKNLLSLETSKVSEGKSFDGFKTDTVVEIYDIKVNYSTTNNNNNEVTRTTDDSEICGDMLVSIPCDIPDLFVISVNDGEIGGDVYAKYVDGRYIFHVNFLGSFMLCSEPPHCAEVPKDYKMIEQTMVDQNTGITVSGMIPEGAIMHTTIENVHIAGLRGWQEENEKPNLLKYDFLLPGVKEVLTKRTSDGKFKDGYNWYEDFFFAEGAVVVDVVFVKEYEVVEFDSDLTVTLPFDYYKVLESKNFNYVDDEEVGDDFDSEYSEEYLDDLKEKVSRCNIAEAFQLNPTTSNLKQIEVLTQKGGTEEFKFKTNSKGSGTFFIGNSILIEDMVAVYGWSYDDLETFENVAERKAVATNAVSATDTDTATDTATAKASNINKILFVVCIATNVAWIAVFAVLIVKNKKKS